jgi:hypothetical protein
MIRHQVPFLNLAFLAPGEFVEYGSQVLPNLPEQQLLAVLWCERDIRMRISANTPLHWPHRLSGLSLRRQEDRE